MLSVKNVKGKLINQSRGNAWRLVHDRKQVITLIQGTDKDITSSMRTIEEFGTEGEALNKIERLGLKYYKWSEENGSNST